MAFELFQGEDKSLVVMTNIDLSSSSEIEFIVDTPSQIIKKLSESEISGVTSTQFVVQIDAADTENVQPGGYTVQARSTDSSSKKTNGKFQPNQLTIKPSAFVSSMLGNDYA